MLLNIHATDEYWTGLRLN